MSRGPAGPLCVALAAVRDQRSHRVEESLIHRDVDNLGYARIHIYTYIYTHNYTDTYIDKYTYYIYNIYHIHVWNIFRRIWDTLRYVINVELYVNV